MIQEPWPSMLRTIYGDDERFSREYWSASLAFISREMPRSATKMGTSGFSGAWMM